MEEITAALPLSDEERLDDLRTVLKELAEHLQAGLPNDANEQLTFTAWRRGERRFAQHYRLSLLVQTERLTKFVMRVGFA